MAAPASRVIREVGSNITLDVKDRIALARQMAPLNMDLPRTSSGPLSSRGSYNRSSAGGYVASMPRGSANSAPNSPHIDQRNRFIPTKCSDIIADIVETFYQREKTLNRGANWLKSQIEVTEKMRTILIDWLVDVHLKFKLHAETFYLAVDIVDRYLSVARVGRAQLQLVGVCAILIAAKHDEIWPPDVRDCIHISANSYSREELLQMERSICSTLQFKFTTPNPYPFLLRLLETVEATEEAKHIALFFLEHTSLDYECLQYLPSRLAAAAMYLTNLTLNKSDPWDYTLQYYSKTPQKDVEPVVKHLMQYVNTIAGTKYQAIRRKYSTAKYHDVTHKAIPEQFPVSI